MNTINLDFADEFTKYSGDTAPESFKCGTCAAI